MKKLFLIDLSSLVVQYAFGVKSGRKDKENKIPFIQTRNGAISFIRRQLDTAGYSHGDEVVVAREGHSSWRHNKISDYKSNRDHSSFEWKQIHSVVDSVHPLLKSQYGFKVMYVFDAEADDIIGSIAIHEAGNRDITILSSDKDFKQLLHYVSPLKIYSPQKKAWVSKDDGYKVTEHIIRGDKEDKIDTILKRTGGAMINGKKRMTLTEDVMKLIMDSDGNFIGHDYPDIVKGFEFNQEMIDFRYIPEDIKTDVIERYLEKEIVNETIF